ncbi:hypothetical protein EV127DRAFT_449065 [Xylaria flabelliformis]|nr:hypothetical protein EV127DRAFT_449065 [Xylaria flabelliformis]
MSFSVQFPAIDSMKEWLRETAEPSFHWLSQPHIVAWTVTFSLVCTLILGLGFGPGGVGFATLAATYQSVVYGGFTPAGGIFATLTSMAMLGTLAPTAALVAALVATMVSFIVWVYGVER